MDDAREKKPSLKISGDADIDNHRDGNEEYSQADDLFLLVNVEQKSRLIGNLADALRSVQRFIQLRQTRHFFNADHDYSGRVAESSWNSRRGARR